AADRLERHSRPQSLVDIEMPTRAPREAERFTGIKKTVEDLGAMLKPQTELEQSALKIRLANAGFRSEQAAGIYLGLRFACLIFFAILSIFVFLLLQLSLPFLPKYAWMAFFIGFGFYLPSIILWFFRRTPQ